MVCGFEYGCLCVFSLLLPPQVFEVLQKDASENTKTSINFCYSTGLGPLLLSTFGDVCTKVQSSTSHIGGALAEAVAVVRAVTVVAAAADVSCEAKRKLEQIWVK